MNTKEIDERFDNQIRNYLYSDETAEVIKSFIHTELSTLRQSVLEEVRENVEKINRMVGNIYKINKDDHNRLDKDLLYLAGETSNLLKKLDPVTSLINNLIEEKK